MRATTAKEDDRDARAYLGQVGFNALPGFVRDLKTYEIALLEGKTITLTRLALNPVNWRYLWNPFTPSWGEPYDQVAERVRAVIERARDAARGREAVCVSHQLPIWVSRLACEHKRLWHNPKSRQCALGSVTSLTFRGDDLSGVSYTVPPRRQVRDPDTAQ